MQPNSPILESEDDYIVIRGGDSPKPFLIFPTLEKESLNFSLSNDSPSPKTTKTRPRSPKLFLAISFSILAIAWTISKLLPSNQTKMIRINSLFPSPRTPKRISLPIEILSVSKKLILISSLQVEEMFPKAVKVKGLQTGVLSVGFANDNTFFRRRKSHSKKKKNLSIAIYVNLLPATPLKGLNFGSHKTDRSNPGKLRYKVHCFCSIVDLQVGQRSRRNNGGKLEQEAARLASKYEIPQSLNR